MIPVLDSHEWYERLMRLERPETHKVLAFYEHRMGAIRRDIRFMLAPLDDHLVHRGDGIFESLLVIQRTLIHLDAHMARMEVSAAGLFLQPPCSYEAIRERILDVAVAADASEANIRVLIGRGPGGFGISPDECPGASLYIIAYEAHPYPEAYYAKGLTAFRSRVPLKSPMLARLKTTNYINGVLMALEAKARGCDVAFSFDPAGCLAEAPIANVAIVDEAGVFMMPELGNILAGTTALKAMELASAFMPVTFRAIPEGDVLNAQEVMVLGTSFGCVGVTHYEGKPINTGRPGPVAERLRHQLHADLLSEGTHF